MAKCTTRLTPVNVEVSKEVAEKDHSKWCHEEVPIEPDTAPPIHIIEEEIFYNITGQVTNSTTHHNSDSSCHISSEDVFHLSDLVDNLDAEGGDEENLECGPFVCVFLKVLSGYILLH